MKILLRLLTLSFYLFSVLTLAGCKGYPSWPRSLPDGNIVFQSNVYQPYELNFIQANGYDHHILNLPQNFVKPVWSSGGGILYGLSSPGRQPPYEEIGYPAYWNLKNSSFKRCDRNLPYFAQIEGNPNPNNKYEVILQNASEIILLNLDTCQQTESLVDFKNPIGKVAISGFSYFPKTQELLFGEVTGPYGSSRDYHLIKQNLNGGARVELAKGINPAWSPDGTRIAYIGLDGLYLMSADGKQSRQLIDTQFFDPWIGESPWVNAPQPRWSPDGESLVYHLCGDKFCSLKNTLIFKAYASDGIPVKIYTGGKFPTWRP